MRGDEEGENDFERTAWKITVVGKRRTKKLNNYF